MLRSRQWLITVGLLLLIGLAVVGLVWTRGSQVVVAPRIKPSAQAQQPMVDQSALQVARKIAPLAATAEERLLAQDALRLADHEVDLAFANALREAAETPQEPSPETRELHQRMEEAEAKVKIAQDRLAKLTKQVEGAKGDEKDAANAQLMLAKAESELDQDEFNDAKEDLIRAGGNPEGTLQRLLDEHEAADHAGESTPTAPVTSSQSADNFLGLAQSWLTLRTLRGQLSEAEAKCRSTIQALNRDHDALEARVNAEASRRQATKTVAAGLASEAASQRDATSKLVAAAAIASLKHFTNDQKSLSTLDKRIQNQKELAETYANWNLLAQARSRAALNGMIRDLLWILIILLLIYVAGLFMDRMFTDLTPDKKRLITLRSVLRFAVQVLGVLIIIFVLFGIPSQTPTVIGLAGAGLTVALKDFIVGFVGWFVLMGRNGLRVGDWVEINGVVGEVVEIGLLRTVLLETGNWADSGHPTGRKVAFVNSFAIEGHFFNFSTSGQWLWDELQLMIPSGRDPHAMIDTVQKLVAKETESDSHLAEQEWQRSSHNRIKSFTADPAINVRPTSSGIEIHVRYITRAQERFAVRTRLYEKMVEVLHGGEPALKG
jgi:small-conductance mechanosensitive channel